jgi:hypothetical protein
VVRGSAAHLFFGPSGAGKTTVTTLSGDALILGDDLVLLREGKLGIEACSVPFRGLYREPPETDRAFPLAGLYRLIQDRDDFLVDLTPSQAVAELIGSIPFVVMGEESGQVLDFVGRLVHSAPVRRLHFRKSAEFWSLL